MVVGAAGVLGVEQLPSPCPLEPFPLSSATLQEVDMGLGWEVNGEGKAVGEQCAVCAWGHHQPLPTVLLWSTPSACTCATSGCGPRAGTRSRGGISSEKRCFPEYPKLALSSPKTWWGALRLLVAQK